MGMSFPSPQSREDFLPMGKGIRRTSPAGSLCTHWTSLTVSAPLTLQSLACSSGPRPGLCPHTHNLHPVSLS